ncbi:MAG: hemin uptake protein HemP [Amaricoccus sp.]
MFDDHRGKLAVIAGQRPCHEARSLTGNGTEATIRLDGMDYVLHITRQGKLILTK